MDPGSRGNHYGIERSSDRTASLAAPLPLARVTPTVEAGDHVDRLVHDPKEQAHTEIVGTERGGRLCRQQGNAVAPRQSGRRPSRLPQQSERPVPHLGRYINRAPGSVQPVQRNQRRPTARSAPLSKLGLKLVPWNAVFSILIETCDAPVELGSLRVGHGYVLIFKALPEVLDQIEALARREPSQLGREISHVVQNGERKRVRQFASPRRAPARPSRWAACRGHECALSRCGRVGRRLG